MEKRTLLLAFLLLFSLSDCVAKNKTNHFIFLGSEALAVTAFTLVTVYGVYKTVKSVKDLRAVQKKINVFIEDRSKAVKCEVSMEASKKYDNLIKDIKKAKRSVLGNGALVATCSVMVAACLGLLYFSYDLLLKNKAKTVAFIIPEEEYVPEEEPDLEPKKKFEFVSKEKETDQEKFIKKRYYHKKNIPSSLFNHLNIAKKLNEEIKREDMIKKTKKMYGKRKNNFGSTDEQPEEGDE